MLLAQKDKDLHWLKLSAGLGGAEIAAAIDYNWAPSDKLISIGVHTIFSERILSPARTNAAAATIGVYTNRKHGFLGASAGVGPVWGIKEGEILGGAGFSWGHYQEIPFTTIGIPIQAEFRFDPIKYAGAGLTFFANLNPRYTYVACMLSLSAGRLKSSKI